MSTVANLHPMVSPTPVSSSPLASPGATEHTVNPIAIPSLLSGSPVAPALEAETELKPVVASSSKPKSTKAKARSPSPSPPPPQIIPLETVRLEIQLGGPEKYSVDVAELARNSGQLLLTEIVPVINPADTSESEDDGDAEDKKVDKRRRKYANEYYDTSDPFIDDSELAIDERTYFAQTKQQGFYVSSGEVALVRDKSSPKKPKSKLKLGTSLGNILNTATKEEGSRESPIALYSDQEHDPFQPSGVGMNKKKDKTAQRDELNDTDEPYTVGPDEKKRKRYVTVTENGKKRKIIDINSFHPDLCKAIESLKADIAKEDWGQKGKFPPGIKPKLGEVAILAVKLDEYDDHFFNLLPVLFPYNKFTMSKLVKRTIFHDHMRLLQERMEVLLRQLEVIVKEGFSKAEEEWQKACVAWDKRQERARLESASANGTPVPADTDSNAPPTRQPTEERMDVDEPVAPVVAKAGVDPHPPTKKYRMTEPIKTLIWELVLLSNECCRLENEKNTLEGSVLQVSEQGLRKVLYQKIVAIFPDGWMSSGQISRDVSAMKKKFEKEALENEVA